MNNITIVDDYRDRKKMKKSPMGKAYNGRHICIWIKPEQPKCKICNNLLFFEKPYWGCFICRTFV